MIGSTIASIKKDEHTRCIAMHGHSDQCPKEAEFLLYYQIQGRVNVEPFCEDDAYKFSMYFSNYLGIKVIIEEIRLKEKVQFT